MDDVILRQRTPEEREVKMIEQIAVLINERNTARHQLADLIDRMERASRTLGEMATENRNRGYDDTSARLIQKKSGVDLALSYAREVVK